MNLIKWMIGIGITLLIIFGIIGYLWAYNWDLRCLIGECRILK